MKHLLTLMKMVPIMVLLAICGASAQTVVTIGDQTSGTTSSYPFYTTYEDSRGYILITAAEMVAAGANPGNISKVGFDFTSTAGLPMNGLRIGMANTSLTSITTANASTIPTTTYYGPVLFTPSATGWVDFTLTNDFAWDGSSNIAVMVCLDNDAWSGSHTVRATGMPAGSFVYYYQDGGSGCTALPSMSNAPTFRPNIRFTQSLPILASAFPPEGAVLGIGSVYGDGNVNKPGVVILNQTGQYSPVLNYKITGPVGTINEEVVYQALGSANTNDVGVTITGNRITSTTERFSFAKGHAASGNLTSTNNGALDLSNPNIRGGRYKVEATLATSITPTTIITNTLEPYYFNIALQNDLELTSILYPRQNTKEKYPLYMQVPVSVSIRNVGELNISSVSVNVKVYYENETTPVYDQSTTYNVAAGDEFPTNATRELSLPNYMPNRGVGTYNVVATATLLNATDQDLANNVIARNNYAFDVAYDTELDAYNIPTPANEISLGRPIVPVAELMNHGISDLSEPVNCRMIVKNLANNAIVYDHTESVESILTIPSGIKTSVEFGENLILNEAGQYECTMMIISDEDPVQTNNTFVKTITVLPGMGGTYTIGSIANAPNADRNYTTIQSALEAIYLRGMSNSIEFELTDMEYNVGER